MIASLVLLEDLCLGPLVCSVDSTALPALDLIKISVFLAWELQSLPRMRFSLRNVSACSLITSMHQVCASLKRLLATALA